MYEFIKDINGTAKTISNIIKITSVNFVSNGNQNTFSVSNNIGTIFGLSINGLAQIKDIHYIHVPYSTSFTFNSTPQKDSVINIQYYQGINSVILDNTGKLIQFTMETFTYTNSLVFNVSQSINSVFGVETNGLAEEEGVGYEITGSKQITLLDKPVVGSNIMISYFY